MAPHVRHDIASDPMFAGVDQPQMDYYMNEFVVFFLDGWWWWLVCVWGG